MSDPLPAPGRAQSWRKLATGSISRQIFGAAVHVALLTALVKAVTIGRELIVARRFGTNDALDAYDSTARGITIEDDLWVAAHCIILDRLKISSGRTRGAGRGGARKSDTILPARIGGGAV